MVGSTKDVWNGLENWRARMFLVGGILVTSQAVGDAVTLTMNVQLEALAFAVFLGLILSYVGLLGLYPTVAERAPRLSLAGLVLVLVPVLLLVVLSVGLLVSSGPPFSESTGAAIFTTIFGGFTLGVVLIAVAVVRTGTPSRAVGGALLGFAVGWSILLGASLVYGFPISDRLTFLSDAIMAVSLLATGILLYTGGSTRERTESAEPVA